jgi:hypothetical protein
LLTPQAIKDIFYKMDYYKKYYSIKMFIQNIHCTSPVQKYQAQNWPKILQKKLFFKTDTNRGILENSM